MSRYQPRISDDEARRLWQRAAELQDEAERSAASSPNALHVDESHLSLLHVAQAAEGAGIRASFVLLAMAEQQLPDAGDIRREDWRARWLRGAVSDIDAIEVSKVVRGSPRIVLAAIRTVAAQPAFNMLPESTVGTAEDPGNSILVYRLQGGSSQFNTTLNFADVRVLLVVLTAGSEGTQLRVRAPLFRRGTNLSIAGVATIVGGVGGSWSGSALAAAAAGALGITAGAALLIPAGIGALAGGVLGLGGFRSIYGGVVKQGRSAISTFVNSVALEVESAHNVEIESKEAIGGTDAEVGA